jgi:8-oxo-dGTP pyrophosphatase MutT (NUDIX family)
MILRVAAKVFASDDAGNVLVLRRSKTHPRYALQWDIPGGFVDEAEDFKDALVREMLEEASLALDPMLLRMLYAKTDFYANGSSGEHVESVVRLYYAGRVQGTQPDATLSYEHDMAAWVPANEALSRLIATPFEDAIRYITEHRLLADASPSLS